MDGFFLIDKPAGITSHDVVASVRSRLQETWNNEQRTRNTRESGVPSSGFRVPRVGHAGTLDPLATGLLIVGVGRATKKLRNLLTLPKTYEAELTLGATSTTDDGEGRLSAVGNGHPPTRDGAPSGNQGQMAIGAMTPTRTNLQRALQHFTGIIEQLPPRYSAVKVQGVPAYRRVRRGETVTLRPRLVTIHNTELLSYTYPILHIRWVVSSGTYIRSLARDLGARLGTGAYLSALRRSSIGPFSVSDADTLDTLTTQKLPNALRRTEDIVRLAQHAVQ